METIQLKGQNLKDDYGAYADETQQEHKHGSDSEGDDQVINPIENCILRADESSPMEVTGSQNKIKHDSETNLIVNDFGGFISKSNQIRLISHIIEPLIPKKIERYPPLLSPLTLN